MRNVRFVTFIVYSTLILAISIIGWAVAGDMKDKESRHAFIYGSMVLCSIITAIHTVLHLGYTFVSQTLNLPE